MVFSLLRYAKFFYLSLLIQYGVFVVGLFGFF